MVVLTEDEQQAETAAQTAQNDVETGSFEAGIKEQDGTLASIAVQDLESAPSVSATGDNDTGTSSSGSNVGIIAGAVVAVALVALIVAVVVLKKRRSAKYAASRSASRRRSSNINYENPMYEEASEPATRDNSFSVEPADKNTSPGQSAQYEVAGADAGEPKYDMASPRD